MNFGELQSELFARGFDYLQSDAAGQSRAKRWLNQANASICGRYQWPFLTATQTGAAPLAISDVQEVLSVSDETLSRRLEPIDQRVLLGRYGRLDGAGSPSQFYLDGSTLKTYPTDSSTVLTVRYLRRTPDLVNDTDEPLVPGRFHDVIVDEAARRAYKDTDEWEAVKGLREEVAVGVQQMVEELLAPTSHGRIAIVDRGEW